VKGFDKLSVFKVNVEHILVVWIECNYVEDIWEYIFLHSVAGQSRTIISNPSSSSGISRTGNFN
jgi:hypothetical protein